MPTVHEIKQQICEIGRRLYNRGFAAANDGNISYRISDNEVICTPTQLCKGVMKPEDLCIVNMDGKQVAGKRKATSEVRMHLAIMKARPDVRAVVHCHPPHATAFGVAREPIPQCVLPEVEIFLGEVPIARYATPGTQEFAETVLPFVKKAKVVILANHGTVSFDEDLERAYWWTEILDAYCRILMLARGLGRIVYFTEPEARALLEVKKKWGIDDPRFELQNCELCANDVFRDSWREAGVQRQAFNPPLFRSSSESQKAGGTSSNPSTQSPALSEEQLEQLVQAITDRVLEALSQAAPS